jgi:hypothetical protein
VVGNKLLKEIGVKPGSPEAYAFTYNNFEDLAAKYGKTGGFGQIKTVLDKIFKVIISKSISFWRTGFNANFFE